MFYVYKTVNKVNGNYYIGKHKGKLDDEYLGSGLILKQALEKYGKNSFQKEILVICLSEEEVRFWEKKIIDSKIDDPKCYNLAPGGQGGYVIKHLSQQEKREIRKKASKSFKEYQKAHPEEVKKWRKKQKKSLLKNIHKHKEAVKAGLSKRTKEEIKNQHNKITQNKYKNGFYSKFKLLDPEGNLVMESIGAEKIADRYGVSANGIRFAANHGNPIKRGNLMNYTVVKV